MDHGAPIEALAFFPSGTMHRSLPLLHPRTPHAIDKYFGSYHYTLSLHTESMLVTAGGQHLCCWDIIGGGRLLHRLTAHQKTVTSVAVRHIDTGSGDAGGLRILSGSLDGHLKVGVGPNSRFIIPLCLKPPPGTCR